MKAILFCKNPYAFGILAPLCEELVQSGHEFTWYVPESLLPGFPYRDKYPSTSSMKDLLKFGPDAIFVPGNEVPHYLPGVKVQVFHGFAGEKKGHFRIRHYFDLYLTQGPYFTDRFRQLAAKYGNFTVAETGWCKLDPLFRGKNRVDQRNKGSDINGFTRILYAPTFSPSLTSSVIAFESISELAKDKRFRILVKFHDLMDKETVEKYRKAALANPSIEIAEDKNILPAMLSSDIMISDTSSAVYEFLLLDRPVITIGSRSPHIGWLNIEDPAKLLSAVEESVTSDVYSEKRKWFTENYHPYTDGMSSGRMIKETINYIEKWGVPGFRKLPYLRRRKMVRLFGPKP